MHILLVLMVKNESRILERCLASAAPFVDAVLVSDTGSTDDTVALANAFVAKPIKVVNQSWCNFGVNRTLSLQEARAYAVTLGWCLDRTYALVIDADMCLRGEPDVLRQRLAAASSLGTRSGAPGCACENLPKGAQLIQKSGSLEYANTRLMLLSDPWFCEGVTHEYWTGERGDVRCISDAAWIEDIGDGGCKTDKFERDERLLLAGLQEKPECQRYMFYLAQTYNCLNRHAEAIHWYKKRIEAGGWVEEIWYSHYMIVCNLMRLDQLIEAETFLQRAFVLQPDRIEALVLFARHLRERGQPFKAWHYLSLASRERPQGARLFLETDAYEHLEAERVQLLATMRELL